MARSLAPTARIIVRTRYPGGCRGDRPRRDRSRRGGRARERRPALRRRAAELPDFAAGDRGVTRTPIRSGGYAALRELSDEPVVVCDLDGRCLDTRTVIIRDGAPLVGQSLESLTSITDLEVTAVDRDHTSLDLDGPVQFDAWRRRHRCPDRQRRSRQRRRCSGRPGRCRSKRPSRRRRVRTSSVESVISFTPHPQGTCTHLDRIVPVHPSARGCEECLRSGDRWVHLRICLTCGHVGCCDSSKNKHATGHYHATDAPDHPVARAWRALGLVLSGRGDAVSLRSHVNVEELKKNPGLRRAGGRSARLAGATTARSASTSRANRSSSWATSPST